MKVAGQKAVKYLEGRLQDPTTSPEDREEISRKLLAARKRAAVKGR